MDLPSFRIERLDWSVFVFSGVVSLIAGLFFAYWGRTLARRIGFTDQPDGRRKVHKAPVALGGGAAVLLAMLVAIVPLLIVQRPVFWEKLAIPDRFTSYWSLLGLLIASFLLCGVGLYDDRYGMSGSMKLFWQVVATAMVVFNANGPLIQRLDLFGYRLELGFLGVPLAMIWILGAINSFNLLDGADGIASSLGIIFSLTLGFMAISTNHGADAMIAFAMAGALLGFLRFNFPPASMYLGDAGSMLIGLVLSTLALRCTLKEAATVAFATPLAIWAIPIFDSLAAVLRRKLTGRSIYATDRGHIHHRLLTHGLSPKQALALISGLALVCCAGAIASLVLRNSLIGAATVAVVVGMLITTRIFGHSELLLLNDRLIGFGRSLMSIRGSDGRTAHTSLQLQGSLQWEKMWDGLIESADRFKLVKIRLNLHVPHLHEDFYATWSHNAKRDRDRQWRAEIPLNVDGANVGRLAVVGIRGDEPASASVSAFLDFVEPLELQLQSVISGLPMLEAEEAAQEISQSAIPKTFSDVAETSQAVPQTAEGR